MRVRPEPAVGIARLLFQVGQLPIPRVAPVPPRIAGPDQLLVQAPAIRQDDLADRPPIAVVVPDAHRDRLAEGKPRRELLRPLAERLALLGGVDPVQADLL